MGREFEFTLPSVLTWELEFPRVDQRVSLVLITNWRKSVRKPDPMSQ